jgi:hypothetical protein
MKLSKFKEILKDKKTIAFELPNGSLVPNNFHVTEVGEITKKFIDCGGTIRNEKVVNFQLWNANDYDHRLHPEKLVSIISLSEEKLGIEDNEIEVEYQEDTIGKYGIDYKGDHFLLINTQTDCLAKDKCDVTVQEIEPITSNTCSPNSGCC